MTVNNDDDLSSCDWVIQKEGKTIQDSPDITLNIGRMIA